MKWAAITGALALLTSGGYASAQSSVDALLNKLEQKGILSVEEARELKAENQQESQNDFNKALAAKFPMPSWVSSYKLSGDFRGRYDKLTGENPAFVDRDRLRYRIRVGLAVKLHDDLELGFRLGSSDAPTGYSTGNPLSNNSTVQDNATKKMIYVDTAYGKWTPLHDNGWLLSTTIGKMDNPFRASNMVFDPDYTPEGAALQTGYQFNDHHTLSFNAAAFVLDELSGSSQDPFMYGAQLLWDAKWTPHVESSLGVAVYDIANGGGLTTGNVPYVNQGNTRTAGGVLAYDYNPIVASGSVAYTFDSAPLYSGAFPIRLGGEYMNNPAAPSANEGYWAGITFGKANKKHNWEISYRYQELQADAWWDQLVDDDNGVFYGSAPTGGKTGYFGGTNIKGHSMKLTYCFTDALTFGFTAYINDLVNSNPGGVGVAKNHAIHCMADLMWKF